ncbi:MAG: restriction endonuclease subunit S [Gallionellaceae bacterium]|jgi:type I restriction enzyme S subunit
MSLPRYPAYKDSGVEWLGEVPGHWTFASLKRGYGVVLGKMLQNDASSPDDELVPYLRAANIKWNGVDISDVKQMWVSPREINQLALSAGDLLISEGGDVGRSAIWQNELEACYFQNSVNRARSKNGNSTRYLYYWISAIKDIGFIDIICNKSTIAHFTAEKVAAVPMPFPPPKEQQTIAAFLDRETGKIDALIAEQRRLAELLAEKRQAVISHAVTKGLNPSARMKDSGIEWLGEVPEHWEIKPIKAIATCNDEVLEESTPKDYEIEYIEISGVDASRGIASTDLVLFGDAPSRARRRLKDGDVLVSTVRTYLRAIAPVSNPPENMIASTGFAVIRPRHVTSHFLGYLFQAEFLISEVIAHSVGVSYPAINASELMRLNVPIPLPVEQTTISAFLDTETAKFDTLTAEANRAIALLQERRSALISAAVTGKIDIRKLSLKKEAA